MTSTHVITPSAQTALALAKQKAAEQGRELTPTEVRAVVSPNAGEIAYANYQKSLRK